MVKVEWEPRSEPVGTVRGCPCGDDLLTKYLTDKASLGSLPKRRRNEPRDAHRTAADQQGLASPATYRTHAYDEGLRDRVLISVDNINPDLDIAAACSRYTVQVGVTPRVGCTASPGVTTTGAHLYAPGGKHVDSLTIDRLRLLYGQFYLHNPAA